MATYMATHTTYEMQVIGFHGLFRKFSRNGSMRKMRSVMEFSTVRFCARELSYTLQ